MKLKKSDQASISTSNINRLCSNLLNKIEITNNFYILFDELELFYQTSDQFDRDRRIIRDLIYTISQINAESAEKERKIFLIATLRTEVLHSVLELGHEISRDVDDYGDKLDWSSANESIDHPLMKLIEKKISTSTNVPVGDVWKSFFPEKINNQDFYRFILGSSYYRPRDIVMLLRVARDFDSSSEKFTTEHFDRSALEFSKQTWIEVTEELLASYRNEEIQSLQRLFLGFNTLFFKKDLEERISNRYSNDRRIIDLFNRKNLAIVLQDLYRIGVIGNDFVVKNSYGRVEKRNRWIFRGNTSLNDSERIALHKSLWKHLSLIPGTPEK